MMRAQTTDPNEGDLVSGIGSEVKVGIDRWSAGQIGLPDVLVAVGVMVGAAAVAWIVRRLVERVGSRHGGPADAAALVLGQATSLAIYVFATGIVLEVLGFSIGPLIVVLVLLVLIFLFLRPLFSNLSAGLLLQLRGPFRPGDVIETADALGIVEEVNARTVVIETADGKTIYVPNGQVLDQTLVNYSSTGRRRSRLSLRLGEGVDLESAAERVERAITGLGGVLNDPPPEVLVTGFDGSFVCLDVRFWHRPEISAERTACDQVGRALLSLVESSDLALADPTIGVRRSRAADIGPETSA